MANTRPPDNATPTMGVYPSSYRRSHNKRIVMNPPESFVMAAAALDDVPTPMEQPIAIGQGGQAVMQAPQQQQQQQVSQVEPEVFMSGSVLEIATAAVASPSSEVSTASVITTASAVSSSAVATSQSTASSTINVSTSAQITPTTISTTSSDSTTTSAVSTSPNIPASSTGSGTASSSIPSSISSTTPSSSSSRSSSPTSSQIAAASPTPTAEASVPFTHGALFIFLCILAALVTIALLATTFSWLIRRSFFPCCRPPTDEDGLDELVQSFHTPSRASSIRRSTSRMSINNEKLALDPHDPEAALQRRSSAFANSRTSPFLHSGTSHVPELPAMPAVTMFDYPFSGGNGTDSVAVPMPAHLFGMTGPLEVRNAVPGEMEEGAEEHGTPRESVAGGTPRFLSVDGNGLDVPWSRQSSNIGLGIIPHPDSLMSTPYLSSPDVRDYLGPPFPSPPATIDEREREHEQHYTSAPPSAGAEPQRAGTWASNLRSSLFAAIAGKGALPEEDRFTRTVLPLHRNSTRRSTRNESAFPIVVEDKDEYHLPDSDAEAIGAVFQYAPAMSTNTSSSSSIAPPPRAAKRLPLRMSAGERYKRYARSQRSGASTVDEESSTESCATWSTAQRGPSRLAGGERAKGQKGLA